MSIFGSICSAIGSAISSVCSAIGSLGSSIASTVAAASASLSSALGPVLSVAAGLNPLVFVGVVLAIQLVSSLLKVKQQDTKPEQLGEIAMKHPELTPEGCGSYENYIKELEKHKDEFNEEEFKKKPIEQQAAAMAVGTGILAKGISEKLKMDVPMDFYVSMVKGDVSEEATKGILEGLSNAGIKDASVFNDYLNNKPIDPEDKTSIETVMSNVQANGGPSADDIVNNMDRFDDDSFNAKVQEELRQQGKSL